MAVQYLDYNVETAPFEKNPSGTYSVANSKANKIQAYYWVGEMNGVYTKVYDGKKLQANVITYSNYKDEDTKVPGITEDNITHAGSLNLLMDDGYPQVYRDGVNVTSEYNQTQVSDPIFVDLTPGYKTFTITKRDITLKSADLTKEYDGTALTAYSQAGGTNVTDLTAGQTDKGYVSGEEFNYSFTGSQLFVGSSDNSFNVSDSSTAQTGDYAVTKQYGTLTVTPRTSPLTITVEDQERLYNGTASINTSAYSVSGELAYGDTISVTLVNKDGSVNAGTYTDGITATYKIMHGDVDVTNMYANVTVNAGDLIIDKRSVTITSGSATKAYDGTPLTKNSTQITDGDGFVGSEGYTATVTGSQTYVGTSKNTFTVSAAEGTNLNNYTITKVEGDLTVTPTALTITIGVDLQTGLEYLYDGTATKVLTEGQYQVSGLALGDKLANVIITTDSANAGVYEVYVLNYDIVNAAGKSVKYQYIITEIKNDVEITKRTITIEAGSASKVYDGTALTCSDYTVVEGSSEAYKLLAGEKVDAVKMTADSTITHAGSTANKIDDSSVTISKADGSDSSMNYIVDTNDGTLTVIQRNVTIASGDAQKAYDGTALTCETISVSGDGFVDEEGATYSFTGSQTEVGSSPNAFTYTLNVGTREDNYNITKVEGTLTVTPGVSYLDYVDGEFVEKVCSDFTIVDSSATTWGTEGETTWYVVSSNVNTDSITVQGDVRLILADDCTLTVTGEENFAGINVTGSNAFTIYAQSLEDSMGSLSVSGGPLGAGIGGGVSESGANITINGGKITAVGGDFAAGIGGGLEGAGTLITINGGTVSAVAGDCGAGIGGGYNGDGTQIILRGGSITAIGGENGGSGIGGGDGGNAVHINVADTMALQAGNDLESMEYVKHSGSEDVANALSGKHVVQTHDAIKIVVKVNDAEKMYDGSVLNASGYSYTGELIAGDLLNVTLAGSITDAGETVAEAISVTVTRNGKDVSSEYALFSIDGTLTVTKRSVSLASEDATKKYDGSALTNSTITVSGDGFVAGEASASVTGSITNAGTTANTITITEGAGFKAGNYDITKHEGTLSVTKRSVTITSYDADKMYDGSALVNDTISITGDGFVEGEATAAVTGSLTDAGTSANTITITEGAGFLAGNYNITKSEGTLSVSKREITLSSESASKVYDGTALIRATISVGGDGFATGEGAVYHVTGSQTVAGSSSNAFTYTLNAGTKAGNYTITEETGTLTVTPITTPITITALDHEKIYDGTSDSGLEYTYTPGILVEGDTLEVQLSGSITDVGAGTVSVASYRVMRGEQDVTNCYTFTDSVDGVLTINKRSVTLVSDSAERLYDGTTLTAQNVTIGGDGFVDGEGVNINVLGNRIDAGTSTNIFTRSAKEGTKLSNYTITNQYGKLIVDKRSVSLTSGDAWKVYDGSPLTCDTITVSGDGFATGEGATYTVTGSQTEIGSSTNTFSYSLNNGTKAANYNISQSEGTLTVITPPVVLYAGDEVASSGAAMSGISINGSPYTRMTVDTLGTVSNISVSDSGELVVSGGSATGTLVGNNGNAMITGSGLVVNTTVSGGMLNVSGGGTADSTEILFGLIAVADSGEANSTTVSGWNASMYVSDGGVANSTAVSGGYMHLSGGGTANSTTVDGYGSMIISSGGVANDVLLSAGVLSLCSGGTVSGLDLTNCYYPGNCYIEVAPDTYLQGTASSWNGVSTFEMKDGLLDGLYGSNNISATVLSGGTLRNVESGYVTVLSGGTIGGSNYYASVNLEYGANVDFTVWDGNTECRYQYVNLYNAYCMITVAPEQASGCYYLFYDSSSNDFSCQLRTTDLTDIGTLSCTYYDGSGIVNNQILYHLDSDRSTSHYVYLEILRENECPIKLYNWSGWADGGTSVTWASAGGYGSYTSAEVSSGGSIGFATIGSNGCLMVSSGGSVGYCDVSYQGTVNISSGGSAGYIYGGGNINIENGGRVDSVWGWNEVCVYGGGIGAATIEGGHLYLNDSGYAYSVSLSYNGTLDNNGTIEYLTVGYGASLPLYGSGYISSAYLCAGGSIGGVTFANDLAMGAVSGGTALISDGVFADWDGISVFSGGTLTGFTVSDGTVCAYSGGMLSDFTVSGGMVSAFCGGTVNSGLICGSSSDFWEPWGVSSRYWEIGSCVIESGAVASAMVVSSGGDFRVDGSAVSTWIDSSGVMSVNGYAEQTSVSGGGSMRIEYGGTASNIIISDGSMRVEYGGTASNTIISGDSWGDNGSMTVAGGGTANYISVCSAGGLNLEQDGVVSAVFIYDQGTFTVSAGCSANDVTVNMGGSLTVQEGGTATIGFTPWSPGTISVIEGGSVTYLERAKVYYGHASSGVISKADVLNDFVVTSGNSAIIYSGGEMNRAAIENGFLFVSSGGTANSTTVNGRDAAMTISSGGVANRTTVNSSGYMLISSGGVANSTTVNSGFMTISSGGVANSTAVNFNGSITISSGGTATIVFNPWQGSISLEEGASATYSERDAGVYYGGEISGIISKGDVMNDLVVTSGNSAIVYSCGVANSTTVNDWGGMYISSGGYADSVIVKSNGHFVLYAGGTAERLSATSGFSIAGVTLLQNQTLALVNDLGVHGSVTSVTVSKGTLRISNGCEANNAFIYANGIMYISSGGVANSTTVSEWNASMTISSGGVANSTTVNSNGNMTISSGGVANSTTVNSSGRMTISSGGVANSTTVNDWGYMYISSGGVANSTTVSGYYNYSWNYAYGYIHVSSGGVANSTIIDGGGMYISSGGEANSTTVNSCGCMHISSGGVANDTTVNAAGSMYISNGGTATNIIWTPCVGYVYADEGAYVTYISSYSGVYFGSGHQLLSHADSMIAKTVTGSMYVMRNGVVNSTTVLFGSMTISSGGVANSTHIGGGSMTISSGGVANSTTVSTDGSMTISNGGVVNSTTVNADGSMTISSGGVANSTTVNSGGYMYISSGGVANSTTVNNRGSMSISRGGVANCTVIRSKGFLSVFAGGTATNVDWTPCVGQIYAADGAHVTFVSSYSGVYFGSNNQLLSHANFMTWKNLYYGSMYVMNSGVANSTTVNFNGSITISSGGVANSTTVNNRGSMSISRGGVANSTTVNSGGDMYISSGGVANSTTINSGHMYISSGGVANSTTVNSGFMTISSGGVANSTTVNSGGRAYISIGGVANNTTVNSGSMTINDGGVANNITVNNGGYMTISSGGVANNVFAEREATIAGWTLSQSQTFALVVGDGIHETINNAVVNNGQDAKLGSGGVANSTTVNGRYASMTISSGGVANNTTVNSCGCIYISSGGVANNVFAESGATVVNWTLNQSQTFAFVDGDGIHETINNAVVKDGHAKLGSGGVANSTTVSGWGYMYISSGGVANCTTVNWSGHMYISSGGVANSTIVSYGQMYISSGGVANSTSINNGYMYIYGGGVANSTTVNSNGNMTISSGGVANSTTVSGYCARIYISSGGVANSTTVNSTGAIHISSGGVANSTTVDEGYVYISNGGEHSGSLQINGGTVSAYAGAIIDFTVAEQEEASVALINDWSRISGGANADYTLTVNSDQAAGTYSLARSASSFSNTITVKTMDEDILGTLSIGETLANPVNCREYTLSLEGTQLRLIVTVKAGEVASTTGAIAVDPDTGIAAATWDGTTTYTAGKIYAGNSDADNTVLLIDNAGATGANKSYVFGGAANADMEGEADIRLYQGTIGAIMGGAQDADHSVGAVDIQIGGGTTSASTTMIYGGGFGSVDGDITITTNANAVVTGQVYGGPMVTSGLSVNVGGDIGLSLNGGTLGRDVTGGARVQADALGITTVAGSATIAINGADFTGSSDNSIYGGGWVFGKAVTAKRATDYDYSIGGVNISIESDVAIGSNNGRGIFGGALSADSVIAQVDGDVSISVSGCSVTNVYGGGWAQSKAESNVIGNVAISLTDVDADVIIGGGAHALQAVSTDIATTLVDGDVSITVTDSTVDAIYAVGQVSGDTVTGDATVTLIGATDVDYVFGCGYDENSVCGGTATLRLDNYTGTISKQLKAFDSVVIDNNTTATFASYADIGGESWTFDLTARTETEAALKWGDGAFDTANFNLILGETATDWTVCNLFGDDVKSEAFEEVSFQLTIGGNTFDYALGDEISETGTTWDGTTLDYSDETGLLKFTLA